MPNINSPRVSQYKKIAVGAALTLVAGAGMIYGLFGAWDWYYTTSNPRLPSSTAVVTESNAKPNETPIDTDSSEYRVATDLPRLIEMPSLGAKGFIQQVGVDQFGAIATPDSIHMVGWYTGSIKPGYDGISVIDGHVRGRYKQAVFSRLHELKQHDAVRITYGDGRHIDFAVVKVAEYHRDKAVDHLFEKQPSVKQQLVLITCSGVFDASSNTYDRRVLVYAKRLG